jgi:hypothetical protein
MKQFKMMLKSKGEGILLTLHLFHPLAMVDHINQVLDQGSGDMFHLKA